MEVLHLESVLWTAATVGLRVSALMVFAPFFNSQGIPLQVKAALTVGLTILLAPLAPIIGLDPGVSWARVVLSEFAIGMILGLTLQFVVESAVMAGQLIGVQAGYSLVTLLDPQTQADTPVLSTLSQMFAIILFLQFNVHHWLLRGLAASFSYLPPGTILSRAEIGRALFQSAGGIWLCAVQIAGPAITVTMLVDLAMGFVAKASPQLPVLLFGLPMKNVLALLSLCGALTLWPHLFEKRFVSAISLGEQLCHLAR